MIALIRRAGLSLALNLITKSANVIAFTLVARLTGPADAGVFSLAVTYLLILSALTWGLDELLIRQVAADRSLARAYFGPFLVVRVVAALLLCPGLWGLLALGPYPQSTAWVIGLMGLSLVPDGVANVSLALLTAHERFEVPVVFGLVATVVKLVAVAVVLAAGYGLRGVAWAWLLGNLVFAVLLLAHARRLAGRGWLARQIDWALWRNQVRVALPYLAIGSLLALEYQVDVIILSLVRDETAVGWYGATTTIVFALMLLPQAYRTVIFPRMAAAHRSAPETLQRLYDTSFRYLGAAALPAAIGLAVLSPRIIELVYGPAFGGAVLPLRILAWSLIFLYLTVPNSRLLLVNDRQTWLAAMLMASLAVNILLNVVLIPRWGASGAAVARLSSTALFFVVNYAYIARRLQAHNLLRALIPSVVAGLVLAVSLSWLRAAPLWVVIPAGAAIYGSLWLVLESLAGGKPLRFRESV